MTHRPAPRPAPRATPRVLAALALLAPLALAACALIPPQTVADPLGIDGVPVRLAPEAAGLAPQQAAPCSAFREAYSHCAALAGATVADLDGSRFTGIVARFETSVGVRATIRAFGLDAATAPAALAIAGGVVDLHVEDEETGLAYDPDPVAVAPAEPVVFLLDADGCVALVCSYTAASTAALAIPLVASGADLDRLLEVLTGGGDNRVAGTLAYDVATSDGSPAPFDVTVVLSSPEGTVRF